jgi:hypothetical protein
MMTTVIIDTIRTRGIAGDGRGEKKELWSVHVVYHQKEAGRQFTRKV